jgi:hypothetical protein
VGSSWWPFGGDEEPAEPASEPGGGGGSSGGPESEHSDEDMAAKENEGYAGRSDVFVRTGGPVPYAVETPIGGFHDLGRVDSVAFGDVPPHDSLDPEEAARPHAYTGGGSSGTVPWSGGGPGGGPKGNQGAGSIQHQVAPFYDHRGNGPFSNADAWVKPGTGIADVTRSYVGSKPGDQGNGWWISSAAASALEAHEQRHVQSTKEIYGSTIEPVLDRISRSETLGKGKTYWSSAAIDALARLIGWESGLKKFDDEDNRWNTNRGQIDTEDFGSSRYPRSMQGPRTIGGKEYRNYLIMNSEPDPT